MRKEKKQYIAPQLTVVTFKAEQGYVNSTLTQTTIFLYLLRTEGNYNFNSAQEEWKEGGNMLSW